MKILKIGTPRVPIYVLLFIFQESNSLSVIENLLNESSVLLK